MKYLIKIDRLAAWTLFLGLILYFVSGYGMIKGVIDPVLATRIHVDILAYIVIVAFVIHTGFAIHLAFRRWKIWNPAGKTLLVLFYLLFSSFFVWVDHFYVRAVSPSNGQSTNYQDNENDEEDGGVLGSQTSGRLQDQTVASGQAQLKIFTPAELADYNGQSGNPAYVAVDGTIYDVSRVFYRGVHFTHFAGKNLTTEFYARHVKSAIAKYPIVGQLAK